MDCCRQIVRPCIALVSHVSQHCMDPNNCHIHQPKSQITLYIFLKKIIYYSFLWRRILILFTFLKTGEVYILYLFLSLCSWPHLQLAPRSLSSISECNMKAFGGNISVFCLLFVIGQTGRRPRNKIYLSRFRPLFYII